MGKLLNVPHKPAGGAASITEFTNDESPGKWYKYCCGQAACLTVATFHKKPKKFGTLNALINAHPPDAVGGWAGTSWQRIRYDILQGEYKFNIGVESGEAALKKHVKAGRPCIVMQDVTRIGWGGLMGGHWTVVFGYNSSYAFCSNWYQPGSKYAGYCSWSTFNDGWDTWLTWAGGMGGKKFLVPY